MHKVNEIIKGKEYLKIFQLHHKLQLHGWNLTQLGFLTDSDPKLTSELVKG